MLDYSKNHYELFGLEPGYLIDSDRLARRFRELQRVVHPDRYAGASEREKRLSMQGSTLINEAYRILRDPIERGRYLLELHGVDPDRAGRQQDPEFLMEQMELREQLGEARSQADPYAVISELMSDIKRRIGSLVARMALCMESASAESMEEAAELLRKMQFLRKLQQDAENLEAQLDEEV